MITRNLLLEKGFFPENLPPCFDSSDLTRCLRGLIGELENQNPARAKTTNYIRYVGTKHDGNRRPYGTPNPIAYFHISSFVGRNWKTFEKQFRKSKYSVSTPRPGTSDDDRAIVVASLSELADKTSEKIRYAPFLLKTDIAQYFPSIYTHSVPWAAHGITRSKSDQKYDSKLNRFNQLDRYIQQSQNSQTRGVLIGPDAFRIIAEFISSEIDSQLAERAGTQIIGAVRHVDDFYIGVKSEIDATIVLSHLREILQNYELQINDTKTKIISGLEPVDDVWAQKLRSNEINEWSSNEELNHLLDLAFQTSKEIGSESPIKLVLRRLDHAKCYTGESWTYVEPKLQRILHHFPHCIDYVCLLVVKRYALEREIDSEGWYEAAALLIRQHISFNHHHEITWLLWLMFTCRLPVQKDLIMEVSKVQNSHISSLLIGAYNKEYCYYKPKISLGQGLQTTNQDWLQNLVGRSLRYSKSHFSGDLCDEFEHLASKNIQLLDFEKHLALVAVAETEAISRSRYGYDSDDEDEDDDDWMEPDEDHF